MSRGITTGTGDAWGELGTPRFTKRLQQPRLCGILRWSLWCWPSQILHQLPQMPHLLSLPPYAQIVVVTHLSMSDSSNLLVCSIFLYCCSLFLSFLFSSFYLFIFLIHILISSYGCHCNAVTIANWEWYRTGVNMGNTSSVTVLIMLLTVLQESGSAN